MSMFPFVSPNEVAALRASILAKMTYTVGKDPAYAHDHDWLIATALTVRDRVVDRWMPQAREMHRRDRKRVYYFSLEFLIGQLLFDSLGNLGLLDAARAALHELGVDLDRIRHLEPDAALGNGGLGRLAACYLESMATLGIAAHGYGIRYEHGLFRQVIDDGWQTEQPENWLDFGNPWEFERPDVLFEVGFGGRVEPLESDTSGTRHVWTPAERVRAVAYDLPIVGWRGHHVTTLRLWRARAKVGLNLHTFNAGDHVGAVLDEARAEALSQILYPADDNEAGQVLRLCQEYFFVAASLHDILRRHFKHHDDLHQLPDEVAIQLNDTHPAIAIPELMRLLIDEQGLGWEDAWKITVDIFAYTNHTLMTEALETWPASLMERVLPRHMQIIYLINARHLDELRVGEGDDDDRLSAVSLIEEGSGRRVRMGHLAFLGSHSVNGVSALHTELMRETVFAEFHRLYPERINNKTNGITFRRWLQQANPGLTRLLIDTLGQDILDTPESTLSQLVEYADDSAFRERFVAQRRHNKERLAAFIREQSDLIVDPLALFDVHIKRIHEYKRQLLNLLAIVALYEAIRADPTRDWVPRVKIFAGKAAASYRQAKLIIKLAHDVARIVNHDPTVRGLLKVVFLPNYNVSLAERIIPATDLSEQISTAGMEASGTGNMKLALNGALTIGTLDGANVEMREHIGGEHMFIFGLTEQGIEQRIVQCGTNAEDAITASPRLAEALNAIRSGVFSPEEPGRYVELVEGLVHGDRFMVCADFEAYWAEQRQVAEYWQQPERWWRSAILNTAHMGWFSSDRAVHEYATRIWNTL
ncbi:glycogen/starch/alpha-glucan phosphorylase [Halomonas shantousis]